MDKPGLSLDFKSTNHCIKSGLAPKVVALSRIIKAKNLNLPEIICNLSHVVSENNWLMFTRKLLFYLKITNHLMKIIDLLVHLVICKARNKWQLFFFGGGGDLYNS